MKLCKILSLELKTSPKLLPSDDGKSCKVTCSLDFWKILLDRKLLIGSRAEVASCHWTYCQHHDVLLSLSDSLWLVLFWGIVFCFLLSYIIAFVFFIFCINLWHYFALFISACWAYLNILFFFSFWAITVKQGFVCACFLYFFFFNVHTHNICYCQRMQCAWSRTRLFLVDLVFNSVNYQKFSAVYVELYFIG